MIDDISGRSPAPAWPPDLISLVRLGESNQGSWEWCCNLDVKHGEAVWASDSFGSESEPVRIDVSWPPVPESWFRCGTSVRKSPNPSLILCIHSSLFVLRTSIRTLLFAFIKDEQQSPNCTTPLRCVMTVIFVITRHLKRRVILTKLFAPELRSFYSLGICLWRDPISRAPGSSSLPKLQRNGPATGLRAPRSTWLSS